MLASNPQYGWWLSLISGDFLLDAIETDDGVAAMPAGSRIEHRCRVPVVPSVIVVANDVYHFLQRIERLELIVAEGAGKLPAQIIMLRHRANEVRFSGKGFLDHHDVRLQFLYVSVLGPVDAVSMLIPGPGILKYLLRARS